MYQKVSSILASRVNIRGKSVGGGPSKGGSNSSSIYNSQGNVHKGYNYHWKYLREGYFNTVIAVRKKKGNKYGKNASKKYVADTKRQISELSSTITEMKTCINAFSGKLQGNNSS